MAYEFKRLKDRAVEIKDWLGGEFMSIRTGRAVPQMVERITLDVYGTKTQIAHLATISLEDRKTLRIAPWEKSHVPGIQTAIDKANLGVSTSPDEAGIRVIFPELTEENRRMTLKIIKEKLEEARISLRKARDEEWNDIQKKEREKEISEDEKFNAKEELEKIVRDSSDELETMSKKKESDILNN